MIIAMPRKVKRVVVLMDELDVKLLDNLAHMMGYVDSFNMSDRSRTIRDSILFTHMFLKSGLYKYFKPLPELAKILTGEGNSEPTEHQQ
jgi:hypothetical protein